MSIEPKICEVKIFQLQSLSNAVRCIDQRFVQEFWYFVSGHNVQSERLQVATRKHFNQYTVFFCRLTRTHSLVVKVSRRELGDSGSILAQC